jgi:hypothetical protein
MNDPQVDPPQQTPEQTLTQLIDTAGTPTDHVAWTALRAELNALRAAEAVLREALATLDARRGREDLGTSRVAVQHPADRAAAAEPNLSTPTTSRSPGRPPTQRATRPAAINE